MPGAAAEFAEILEQKYGLTHQQSAFWWVHEEADREHGGGAVELVSRLAQTDDEQRRVCNAVQTTLELMWSFFDGVSAAHGTLERAA